MALLALPVPIKAVLDLLAIIIKNMITPKPEIPARKLQPSFFEDLTRLHVAYIRIGETPAAIESPNAQPEGTTQTIAEAGLDPEWLENMDQVPPLFLTFMHEYKTNFHWSDYGEPRDRRTMSLDNFSPNLASRRRFKYTNYTEGSNQRRYRRESAPPRM